MKKKGFTLIELLAVIVILAIIALIATPIIMNVIENSKKGAAERSADNYMNAVETAVAEERIDGVVLEGEYTIQEDGNLCPAGETCTDETEIKIDMSGNKPSSGTIKIANGLVTTESTMTFADNYTVSYDSNKGSYVASKEESGANTTTTVYRWSTDKIDIEGTIDPSDSTKFATDYATLRKDYFLKHELDADNKVIASYACAVFGDDAVCVRGGTDANGNSYYNENKSKLEDLNTKGFSCTLRDSESTCQVGSVNLSADSTGFVISYDDIDNCRVDGPSYCMSI